MTRKWDDRLGRENFSRFVARRLEDEGFTCVRQFSFNADTIAAAEAHLPVTATLVFTFVKNGIPRRLDFHVEDALQVYKKWGALQWRASTVVGVGVMCEMCWRVIGEMPVVRRTCSMAERS